MASPERAIPGGRAEDDASLEERDEEWKQKTEDMVAEKSEKQGDVVANDLCFEIKPGTYLSFWFTELNMSVNILVESSTSGASREWRSLSYRRCVVIMSLTCPLTVTVMTQHVQDVTTG
ncbi:hypothetical protein TURU_020269 [Turdus rufiventris]|nr:hypothetical protein TURU_020269 [Turdus rufiventris]